MKTTCDARDEYIVKPRAKHVGIARNFGKTRILYTIYPRFACVNVARASHVHVCARFGVDCCFGLVQDLAPVRNYPFQQPGIFRKYKMCQPMMSIVLLSSCYQRRGREAQIF